MEEDWTREERKEKEETSKHSKRPGREMIRKKRTGRVQGAGKQYLKGRLESGEETSGRDEVGDSYFIF